MCWLLSLNQNSGFYYWFFHKRQNLFSYSLSNELTPVSYTHLDVYKRQILNKPTHKIFNLWISPWTGSFSNFPVTFIKPFYRSLNRSLSDYEKLAQFGTDIKKNAVKPLFYCILYYFDLIVAIRTGLMNVLLCLLHWAFTDGAFQKDTEFSPSYFITFCNIL